jgi:hypothetical protein
MSDRNDRSIPGNRTLLVVAAFLVLLGAGSFYAWWKLSARAASQPGETQDLSSPAVPLDEPVPMTLYLPTDGSLAASSIPVKRQAEAQSQAREIVSTLLSDEQQGKGAVLSNVKLRELYLDPAGTAYLDLSVVPKDGIRSSAWEELFAVYAVANSLLQNVEEVKRVRFLVDGKEAQTLAGHIDLARSYTKRMDLIKQ